MKEFNNAVESYFHRASCIIHCIVICAGIVACQNSHKESVDVPYYNTPDFMPIWETVNPADISIHTIPPFSFINQYGDTITQKNTENKIYLVNFFFTSCSGICPRMTETLLQVYKKFKNDSDVMIISHSVDPDHDTPDKLLDFARRYGIPKSNWEFVTGNRDSIYTLARRGYFVEQVMGYNKSTKEFLHSENIILVDKHKHIRGIFNGTVSLDGARMIDDIEKLKKEK